MKKYWTILGILVLVSALVSCQRDDKQYTSFMKDAAGYHVLSDGDVDLDKQFPVWADQLGSEPMEVDPCDPNGYNQVEGKSTFMQMFSPLLIGRASSSSI